MDIKKLVPIAVGLVMAFVVYLVPESKPIACGGAAAIPMLWGN